MGAPKQTLTLDVGKRNASRRIVYLGEGDVNGTVLIIYVTEDGKPFDCSEYTPYVMIPVRNGTVYRQEGAASGNVVTVTVNESGLGNVDGRLPGAYVSLEAGDGTITSTQRFDVTIIKSNRESVAPDTFATDLEALTARVAALEAAMGMAADDTQGDGSDDTQDNGPDETQGDGSGDDQGGDPDVTQDGDDATDDVTGGADNG